MDHKYACEKLKEICEKDPPYNAEVKLNNVFGGSGISVPPIHKYIEESLNNASLNFYERPML